jgi:hypothetical protein
MKAKTLILLAGIAFLSVTESTLLFRGHNNGGEAFAYNPPPPCDGLCHPEFCESCIDGQCKLCGGEPNFGCCEGHCCDLDQCLDCNTVTGACVSRCRPEDCRTCDGNGQCQTCGNDPNKACCNGQCYDVRTHKCCHDAATDYICDINFTCCNGNCCDPEKCESCVGNGCVHFPQACPIPAAGCLAGGACGLGNFHEEVQVHSTYPMCISGNPCDKIYICIVRRAFADENCTVEIIGVYCTEEYYGCNPVIEI